MGKCWSGDEGPGPERADEGVERAFHRFDPEDVALSACEHRGPEALQRLRRPDS